MREGRPVRGGAAQTRELLRRNEAISAELERRGAREEDPQLQRALQRRGQAMPDAGPQGGRVVDAEPMPSASAELYQRITAEPETQREFVDVRTEDGAAAGQFYRRPVAKETAAKASEINRVLSKMDMADYPLFSAAWNRGLRSGQAKQYKAAAISAALKLASERGYKFGYANAKNSKSATRQKVAGRDVILYIETPFGQASWHQPPIKEIVGNMSAEAKAARAAKAKAERELKSFGKKPSVPFYKTDKNMAVYEQRLARYNALKAEAGAAAQRAKAFGPAKYVPKFEGQWTGRAGETTEVMSQLFGDNRFNL
jgi:hypothetical protein